MHKKAPRAQGSRGREKQPLLGRLVQTKAFNYHIRNIYAKLGVHSRQELLIFVRNQQDQQKQ